MHEKFLRNLKKARNDDNQFQKGKKKEIIANNGNRMKIQKSVIFAMNCLKINILKAKNILKLRTTVIIQVHIEDIAYIKP